MGFEKKLKIQSASFDTKNCPNELPQQKIECEFAALEGKSSGNYNPPRKTLIQNE